MRNFQSLHQNEEIKINDSANLPHSTKKDRKYKNKELF